MSRSDRFTEISTYNNNQDLFSDFLMDFSVHPEKNDLVRSVNETAVKRSIRNLLLTNKYERFFAPSIGSDINKLLFENISASVSYALKDRITNTIKMYEPRCRLIDVNVIPVEEQNGYYIDIQFATINTTTPVLMQIKLNRIR